MNNTGTTTLGTVGDFLGENVGPDHFGLDFVLANCAGGGGERAVTLHYIFDTHDLKNEKNEFFVHDFIF